MTAAAEPIEPEAAEVERPPIDDATVEKLRRLLFPEYTRQTAPKAD